MFKRDASSYWLSVSGLEPELKAVCWTTADARERCFLLSYRESHYTLIFGIPAKDKGLLLKAKD